MRIRGLLPLIVSVWACAHGAAQAPPASYSIVYNGDVGLPYAAPTASAAGTLYGTGEGSVWALTPPSVAGGQWSITALYNFPSVDEYTPVTIGAAGELYGVTTYGPGQNPKACAGDGCGSVYIVTPPSAPGGAWTEAGLFTFSGGADGRFPRTGLLVGQDGTLYGSTAGGGSCANCGTVFSLTPPSAPGGAWAESVLYSFSSSTSDGHVPQGNLVMASDGSIYGTTQSGGVGLSACTSTKGCGTVFRVSPPAAPGGAWTEAILYSFAGGIDGQGPISLAMGSSGELYGTTAKGDGTVFKLSPPSAPGMPWQKATLFSFGGKTRGKSPRGSIVLENGVLYGTTVNGGSTCGRKPVCGVVYALAPPSAPGGAWTQTLVHSFRGGTKDGLHPWGGLSADSNGVLWGTTLSGGTYNDGIVFQVTP